MYELIQLTDHDYYIDCPAKIGLVRITDSEAVLIDSGNDKDAGKKVLRILEGQGWSLKAIYNTHSHADHIGGNRFLQDKTGCDIYAKGLECVYTGTPLLEPIGLYGGLPFKELRHKFLMAQESRVQPLTEDVLPEGMQLLSLPGHCFDMAGFLTKDGTAYIADSVSSRETLQKYGIGYLWDPDTAVRTLAYLQTVRAARFVPAHAAVTEDIRELAGYNIEQIKALEDTVAALCAVPVSFEDLLKMIFDRYQMTMNLQQYALIGSTVRSCLSCLYTQGRLSFTVCDNRMLWQAAETADEKR